MNANELWSSIGDLHVWGVVLVTGLAGAAGGLVHAASQNPAGLTDVPGAPPLKKWKQMLVGALAAVAVLYYAAPKPGIEWIAAALLGGYAGDAVMAALAARFTAALAQRTAEQANVRAETLRQIAEDRRAAATELIGMVEQLRPSQAAATGPCIVPQDTIGIALASNSLAPHVNPTVSPRPPEAKWPESSVVLADRGLVPSLLWEGPGARAKKQ